MLGRLLSYIRRERNLKQTDISEKSKINLAHISHIERGERLPSRSVLYDLTKTLELPYKNFLSVYDVELIQSQKLYEIEKHIIYDKIPVFSNLIDFVEVDEKTDRADFVILMTDESMETKFQEGQSLFIERNAPLDHKDIGVFYYNNEIIVRRFLIRKSYMVLRPENKNFEDIIVKKDDNFKIIGKVLNK